MEPSMFNDGLTGEPLINLLNVALRKRREACAKRSQNLRLKTTNSKFAKQIKQFLRANRQQFDLHQAELRRQRHIVWERVKTQTFNMAEEFTASYFGHYSQDDIEEEFGHSEEQVAVVVEPPVVKRSFKIPRILRRHHAKRIQKANAQQQSTEVKP